MASIVSTRFESNRLADGLAWCIGNEAKWSCPVGEKGGLRVVPNEKTDFWRKTYYEPEMLKGDGHLLAVSVPSDDKVVTEVSFSLSTVNQFDQAGVMVWVDEEHWLKAGLEFSDGHCLMGCVVTNEFSDWSVRQWSGTDLSIRLYKLNNSCVVEAQSPDGSWEMVRLAYLKMSSSSHCRVGLFTCAPTAAGTSTVFHSLNVSKCEGYHHHA